MSAFIGEMVVKATPEKSDPWEMYVRFGYQSDVAGKTFWIEPGFGTDFCSVPRVPIAYEMLGNRCPRSGAHHDNLYSSHEIPRQMADEVLREMLILEGVCHVEAMEFYLAVRACGGSHW